MLVPESGGEPVTLTELEPGETPNVTPSHRWPEFLPDGKTVLFTKTPNDNDYDIADIVAVSVADGTEKVLVKGGTFPRYVPTGFLVFLRQGTLFAARFSAERVELLGPPVPVLEGVAFANTYGSGHLCVLRTTECWPTCTILIPRRRPAWCGSIARGTSHPRRPTSGSGRPAGSLPTAVVR